MRRFLLICAVLAVLAVPAAASSASEHVKSGYLVVRNAVSDGGVGGRPVVTLVMSQRGFVLGHASLEAQVEVYHLGAASQLTTQVNGDVSPGSAHWNGLNGKRYTGSNFRFRITGRQYRVVVRGSGIYLFAGGHGTVKLRGSSVNPRTDGKYSVDASRWRSMPTKLVKREIGRG